MNQLTTEQQRLNLELTIALVINTWPALSLAVDEQWGGRESHDKRDWLVGEISRMMTTSPSFDEMDLEDMLLQILSDEFNVEIDDGSESLIAKQLFQVRTSLAKGDTEQVDRLYAQWKSRATGKADSAIRQLSEEKDNESSDSEESPDHDE